MELDEAETGGSSPWGRERQRGAAQFEVLAEFAADGV